MITPDVVASAALQAKTDTENSNEMQKAHDIIAAQDNYYIILDIFQLHKWLRVKNKISGKEYLVICHNIGNFSECKVGDLIRVTKDPVLECFIAAAITNLG